MHIAQGVLRAINVNKLTSTGCLFKFWVADWFAQLNNKMDGDLKKIRMIGQYMIEIWKAIGKFRFLLFDFRLKFRSCTELSEEATKSNTLLRFWN